MTVSFADELYPFLTTGDAVGARDLLAIRAFADQPVDDPIHTQVRRLVTALERP